MIKEVLKESKDAIKGKTLKSISLYVLYIALVLMFSGEALALTVISFPAIFGVYYYFLNMRKGEEKFEDLIEFYIDIKTGLKLSLAMLWYTIIVLFGLIIIIPGIIWSYRYILVFFLLIENRDMKIEDAFAKSRQMMKGYKFKFFLAPMIMMFLPLVMYIVGISMMVVPSISAYSELKTVMVSEIEESLVEDEIILEETEEVAELEIVDEDAISEDDLAQESAISDGVTEELENVAFIFGGVVVLLIGCVWIIIIAPRATLAEVIMYEKIKAIHNN